MDLARGGSETTPAFARCTRCGTIYGLLSEREARAGDGCTILAYLPANVGHSPRQDVVAIYWDAGSGWATAYSGARLDAEPTYWMPLPNCPAALEPQGGRRSEKQRSSQTEPLS
jgi:hypothetical protein